MVQKTTEFLPQRLKAEKARGMIGCRQNWRVRALHTALKWAKRKPGHHANNDRAFLVGLPAAKPKQLRIETVATSFSLLLGGTDFSPFHRKLLRFRR